MATAKAAMPEPVEFDWHTTLTNGFARGGLAGFVAAVADVKTKSEQASAAHQQAVTVMTDMEKQSRAVDTATPWFTPPPDPVARDSAKSLRRLGQHGFKRNEQTYLSNRWGARVSGAGFESEHALPYEALSRALGDKRGGSAVVRQLENLLPAYQEARGAHSGHIGTRNKGAPGDKDNPHRIDVPDRFSGDHQRLYGYRSTRYRDDMLQLISEDRVAEAISLNQLGYAHTPAFLATKGTLEGRIADDSYQRMVEHMGPVPYADSSKTIRWTSEPTAHDPMPLSLF
jgi:hypothetical protein